MERLQLREVNRLSDLALVAFEPRYAGFVSSIPIAHLDYLGESPEIRLQQACEIYSRSIGAMRELLADLDKLKGKRIPIPARKMWELGDTVLALVAELEQSSMEPDNLNEQLVRDLGLNVKRLGTIVTFRRHLPDIELIPEFLGWSQCEKHARKVAQELKAGQPGLGQ